MLGFLSWSITTVCVWHVPVCMHFQFYGQPYITLSRQYWLINSACRHHFWLSVKLQVLYMVLKCLMCKQVRWVTLNGWRIVLQTCIQTNVPPCNSYIDPGRIEKEKSTLEPTSTCVLARRPRGLPWKCRSGYTYSWGTFQGSLKPQEFALLPSSSNSLSVSTGNHSFLC